MSIHRRLVMTAAAVLACAAAGGGLAVAQGGASKHRGRHSSAHLKHHKRASHRGRLRSTAGAGARAERLGRHRRHQRLTAPRRRRHERVGERRRGAERCERARREERRECTGGGFRRALRSCDFDDVPRAVLREASPELREDCAERAEAATPEIPTTTEVANFAG